MASPPSAEETYETNLASGRSRSFFLTSLFIELIDPPPMVGLFVFVWWSRLATYAVTCVRGTTPFCYTPRLRGPQTMPNLSSLVKQLKKERDRVAKQLAGMDAALTAFATVYRLPKRVRRVMNIAARKKIAAAQRRRWAKFRAARK
jgi:hypothetical protein